MSLDLQCDHTHEHSPLEGSFQGRPVTKWAEDYPCDLAEIMINIFAQDRKDSQDHARSYAETTINASAGAEEDQEQEVRSDTCVFDCFQCFDYPRSLAVRFFMLLEDRGIQCFHDRSDPLFQDKVLDTLRSTMFQSLSLADIDHIAVHAFTIGEEGFDVSMLDKVALITACQTCTVTHIRQCDYGLYAN